MTENSYNYYPAIMRTTTPDPMAEKYYSTSTYAWCNNNPVKFIDPDGRDGILVVFPDYKVDTESPLGKQPLGHAGVLLIDNKTGYTRYYEYGRYHTEGGTKGKVKNISISNVVIDPKTDKPTQESFNKVLGKISKASGQNGRIQGAYVEGDFDKMNDYAQGKLNESNPNHPNYNKDRKPYSLIGNNCGTFSCAVLKQDPKTKKKAPWIFIPTPDNIAEEYQDNFPKVDYNPKTKQPQVIFRLMKKWLIIILDLVVFGVLFSKCFFNQPCELPEKPKFVPERAIWSGSCDGGEWIELIDMISI